MRGLTISARDMLHEPDSIRFASDATLVGLWAGGLFLIAGLALVGDWRRARRNHVDKVGWMPWTRIFMLSCFAGILLMALAIKGWLAGG